MKVAWDARKLRDGGIGTYIRNVLHEMAGLDERPELVALLDPTDLGRSSWPAGRVVERPVRARKYSLAEHWVVPAAARACGAHLLHSPHYTLPLGWGGPAVVTIFDLIHIRFAHFYPPGAALYARALAGTAARRARLVLASSERTRDDLVELLRVPAARVRVIPLGVSRTIGRRHPDEVEAFRRERRLPSDYLLYVGARKPHKNLALLLRVLAAFPASARPPLVLSGPAPARRDDTLVRLARELAVESAVHFAGDLADEAEVSRLYSGAALYVHPSLYEGFGLPPLEAMACGVPVLSSNGGSLPEAVGDAAVTLPPDAIESWVEAVRTLLADSGRRAELARRGRERAAGFTWERTARRTVEAYAEAVAG